MGIFSSKKKSTNRTMAENKRAMSDQINLVGEGTTFEGTLHTGNDVRASGHIVGTMHVDGRAIIAESGSVEGEVIATNADIAGHVQGEVHVAERLVLKSTARIDGDIRVKRLVVEEGASFTGQCIMGEDIVEIDTGGPQKAHADSKSAEATSTDKPSENKSASGSDGEAKASTASATPSS